MVPAERATDPVGTGLQTGIVLFGRAVQLKYIGPSHVPQREHASAMRQVSVTSCGNEYMSHELGLGGRGGDVAHVKME